MPIYQILSSLVRRQGAQWRTLGGLSHLPTNYAWPSLLGVILIVSLLLVACSDANGINGGGGNATPTPVSTSRIHWCGNPLMVFRDEAAPTTPTPGATTTPSTSLDPANGVPKTITDWKVVKANLGFTIFLPSSFPAGTCLTSASGTLRDPVIGSNFTVGYLLPNHDAISLSEAPLRSQKNAAFQCSVSAVYTTIVGTGGKGVTPTPTTTPAPAQDPIQLCTGGRDATNIVFSARGSTASLQKFFLALQPNIDWLPAS